MVLKLKNLPERIKMRISARNYSAAFILFLLFSIPAAQKDPTRGFIVKVGDKSPPIKLELINGEIISNENLKGMVTVLQFTASWCSVCREEMPHLEKEVWQKFKEKNFKLIGIDRDEPMETVQKFARDMKITYPLALDPGADIFGKFALQEAGVTRNVVIDQNGIIRFLTRLYDKDEFKKMVTVIAKLLEPERK